MWADLATLTPSLVVCVAFLIGVALFLRREMAPRRRRRSGGSPDASSDTLPDDSVSEGHRTGERRS
jgi:hypothetical protein